MIAPSQKKSLLTVLSILAHIMLFAQASFTVSLSPKTIGRNETTELRLMVENAQKVDQIVPPSLKNFTVLSGPNQESGMENNNGVTRQYIGITYVLQPKNKGNFIISGATAKADGKELHGNSVSLQVTNNATGNRPSNTSPFTGLSPFADRQERPEYKDYILKKGDNVADKINRNIFIKVDVNKHSCYVGEPVVVTYKLYTRLKSESSIIKNPSFNGFSVIDLLPPGNNYYAIEKLDGREYNVYTLRKSQLYPLQTGNIELESSEVENNIHFIKAEYLSQQQGGLDDLFRDFTQTTIPAEGMIDEKVTLRSKPDFIEVKPLPEQGKPASFNGAVGNFTLQAAVEKNAFTTDDAGKLKLVLSGEGNMTLVNTPEVTWPAGVENFDPVSKEQLNKYAVPVSGIKVFEYPFTVEKAGNYTLPLVNFTYFSLKDGAYKTISTAAIPINVAKGSGKKAPVIAPASRYEKHDFAETLFTNRWLIIVPLAIMLIAGLLIWLKKDNSNKVIKDEPVNDHTPEEDIFPTTAAPLHPVDFNPLAATEEQLIAGHSKAFYTSLNTELRNFLADKLQLPVETINKKRIAEEADKKGIPVHTCLQIQHSLDAIEWQLYTPFADQDKMQEMYNEAGTIVRSLNAMLP